METNIFNVIYTNNKGKKYKHKVVITASTYKDLFEKLNVSDVPEDVPSKLSGWLFAKCESLPEVGFTMDYLARYAMLNEETDEYDDYQKMISFTIHKVKNRMIDSVLVTIRDATDEEVEKYEKEHKEE